MKRLGGLKVLVVLVLVFTMTGCSWVKRVFGEEKPVIVTDPAPLFEDIEIAEAYKPIGQHNPILPHRFGADPYALAYEDRVYVYSTNDAIIRDSQGNVLDNNYGLIRSINVVSSADLVNWTDHGWIDVGPPARGIAVWAGNSWAPAAIYKEIDGKDQFFLYFANSANGIGVLTSDSPVGPFVDPIRRPLVSRSVPNANVMWLFDPAVVLDDEGNGYLYFGGGVPQGQGENPGTARVVALGDDMISLAGTPQAVEAPWFFEAAFVMRIDDTYYYTYCTNFENRTRATGDIMTDQGEIVYMTSTDPMGPWEYQGSILKNPGAFFGVGGNNHHSIAQFNDQWYIFYHARTLEQAMGIDGGYRSTHVDKLTITEDGVILSTTGTRKGVDQIKFLDPYQITEAETMAWAGNITVTPTSERSAVFGEANTVVTDMATGSFIGLSGVDFGSSGATQFTAKVASTEDINAIKITTGSPENEAYGYLVVPNTGSLEKFVEVTVELERPITGVNDLFFIFAGDGFAFDAWQFHN